MAVTRSKTVAFSAIVIASLLHIAAAQTTYTVGGTTGWTIPQGGASAYSSWAANNSFAVGDIIVFNFAAGAHDVTQVSRADYDSCTGTNPLATYTTSPARVALNSSGELYFICNFSGHCSAGQKVTVNVLGSTSGAPSPAPVAASPAPMATSPAPRRALSPASAPSPVSTVTAPAPGNSPVAGDGPSPSPSTSPVAGDGPSSGPAPSSRPPMTYTVGDAFGWNIPSSGSLFRDWAAGKDFMVGDTLVFNYAAGAHNVAEVTSDSYTACTTANPISLDSNPPSRITLTTSGEHFYICAIAGHCSAGQQLTINVTGATTTGSTTPGATSPSGSTTPSSPTGDTGSATSVGVSAAAFLSLFLALLL